MKIFSVVIVLGAFAGASLAACAPIGAAHSDSRASQADGTGSITIRTLTIDHCFTDLVVDRFESPNGSDFSARLNLVPTDKDGVYSAVGSQAALANEIFVLKGTYDDNAQSFDLREAFASDDNANATSFSWDGSNGSITVRGDTHDLTGCTTSVKTTELDPGKVKDTTVLSAKDGDATTAIVRREYAGITRLCYTRDPQWDLVSVKPTADQLPNLLAAANADLAKGDDSALQAARTASGIRFPIKSLVDFQYASNGESPYPVLQAVSFRSNFGATFPFELPRCDYASVPDLFRPPPVAPPALPGAGPQ
jgi:hypothetical protein